MDSQVRNQSIAAILILALCCIAIFLFGCSENPAAVNPNDREIGAVESGSNSADSSEQPVSIDTVLIATDTVTGLVDPNGDTLHLHIQGKKVDFYVPAGALSEAVTITIIGSRYKVGSNKEFYTYECGPSGLQFALPLELTQPVNKSDGANATLWYYDDSALDGDDVGWESLGVSKVKGGKGTFLISHFSKYGVSYSCSNGSQYGDIETETNVD